MEWTEARKTNVALSASNFCGALVLVCLLFVFASDWESCGVLQYAYWSSSYNCRGGLTHNCCEINWITDVVQNDFYLVSVLQSTKGDCHRAGVGARYMFVFSFIASLMFLVTGIQRQLGLGYKVCAFGMFLSVLSSLFLTTGITLYGAENCVSKEARLNGPVFYASLVALAASLLAPKLAYMVPFPQRRVKLQLVPSLRRRSPIGRGGSGVGGATQQQHSGGSCRGGIVLVTVEEEVEEEGEIEIAGPPRPE